MSARYWLQVVSTYDPSERSEVWEEEGPPGNAWEVMYAGLNSEHTEGWSRHDRQDVRVLCRLAEEGEGHPGDLHADYRWDAYEAELRDDWDPASVGWDVRQVMEHGTIDPDRLARVGALRINLEGVLEEFQGRNERIQVGFVADGQRTLLSDEPVEYGEWVAVEEDAQEALERR